MANVKKDVGIENERERALDAAIAKIRKEHGEGAIMKLTDDSIRNIEVIPSGCLGLDLALGIGGLPRGRIVEIFGPESSGKTTLTLHVIAQAQKMGLPVAFIDAEHALDPYYAKNLGIDLSKLYVSQPDSGEDALNILEDLVSSAALGVIVVDSVAALTPQAEIDGEMEDSQIGLQARLMSKALRKLVGPAEKTGTCIIFINQLRDKVGVFFGSPETTTGGKALKFYTSVRIDIRKTDSIKDGSEIIGSRAKVKVVKNKIAPPFKEAEFDIIYGKGISKIGDIIDLAANDNIIVKSGSWFSYNGEKIGQGRDNTKQFLMEHPEIADEIEKKVRDKYVIKPEDIQEEPDEELPEDLED